MRVLILTARPGVASNRRLSEAAEKLGVEARIVDATQCVSSIASSTGPTVVAGGLDISASLPAAVIPRVGNWRPETMLAQLETCLRVGAVSPNLPGAIRRGRDHWQTIITLSDAGLPVPASVSGMDPAITADVAIERLGLPVVIKVRHSRMGVGVMLCRRRDHLESLCDSLWRVGDEFVLQEMVPCDNQSIRALVIGGKVVAAARFSPSGDEWRSNGARGGSAEPVDLGLSEQKLATDAADAMGLGLCGVDLLPGVDGAVVCEVNPTPGFLRLETASQVDVADAIVRWVVTLQSPCSE